MLFFFVMLLLVSEHLDRRFWMQPAIIVYIIHFWLMLDQYLMSISDHDTLSCLLKWLSSFFPRNPTAQPIALKKVKVFYPD